MSVESSAPVMLPAFRSPRRRSPDPPLTDPADGTADPGQTMDGNLSGWNPNAGDGGSAEPPERLTPNRATDADRTSTSDTPTKVDMSPAATVTLVVALLSIAFAGAGAIARWRKGYRLRQPDRDELKDMARPLASIARRHIPSHYLNADLADAAELAAAFTRYAEPEPILIPAYPDAGVPAGLQDAPEE